MNEERALSCQTPGRALPPPRAVPQRHGGRVPPPDRLEAANQAVDCLLAKQIAIPPQKFFCMPPLKFALGRGREVRCCPVPRLPRLACPIQRTAAGASAHSPRAARAAPRTAPTPAPTPLACAHHRTRRCRPSPGPHPATNTRNRVRRRPTPPAPVPVGGWAAGGRVTSGCARESVGLRRCALLGGAAGGGAAEACEGRRCDVHEPIADATGAAPPLPPPPPPPPSLRHPRHRHHHRHTLTLLSPPPAFSARRSVAARSSARTGDHAARKVTRDK